MTICAMNGCRHSASHFSPCTPVVGFVFEEEELTILFGWSITLDFTEEQMRRVVLLVQLCLLLLPAWGGEIEVPPGYPGGLVAALAAAAGGDRLLLLAGGIYDNSSSHCSLHITKPNIEIAGPSGVAPGQRPRVVCGTGQRFAMVSSPDVVMSDFNVSGGDLPLAESEAKRFGGCIYVDGGGGPFKLQGMVFEACGSGALHADSANVTILDTVLANNTGNAAIATGGAFLRLEGSRVVNTKEQYQGNAQLTWSQMCGGSTTEATCRASKPITANMTLCQAAGMDQPGNYREPYFGGNLRQCPGSTPDMCVVYQALNIAQTVNRVWGYQAPGGDFGGACDGFCGAFGLKCWDAWDDLGNTCQPNPGTTLTCTSKGSLTSDHVCTCVRQDALLPSRGVAVKAYLSSLEVVDTTIEGAKASGIVGFKSNLLVRGSSVMGADEGIVLEDSTLFAERTAVLGHTKVGVLFRSSRGDLREVDVIGNSGIGVSAVESHIEGSSCNVSLNGAQGLLLSLTGLDLAQSVVARNGKAGLQAEHGRLTLTNSTFGPENHGGGMWLANCTAEMHGGELVGNHAQGSGGGLSARDTCELTLVDVTVSENFADEHGGGIYMHGANGGTLTLLRGNITGNEALGQGGGLRLDGLQPVVETLHISGWGPLGGCQTNGTHIFFFSESFVFGAYQIAPGPGYGEVKVLSGVMGNSSIEVHSGISRQSSSSPPKYAGLDVSFFIISRDKSRLYHCESETGSVRVIMLPTGDSYTLAGGGCKGVAVDGMGTEARFIGPMSLTESSDGKLLYVIDSDYRSPQLGGCIRTIDIATGQVDSLTPVTKGHRDGTLQTALLDNPGYSCLDDENNILYFSEQSDNARIRMVDLNKGTITTVAGGGPIPDADGLGTAASFKWILGMDMDLDKSTMFVADMNRIRKIKMRNHYVYTFAGDLSAGNNDGRMSNARFSLIQGMQLNDAGDTLYFSDRYNHRIGRVKFFSPSTVFQSIFERNRAGFIGGAVSLSDLMHRADDKPSLEVKECTFKGNDAVLGTGGGLSAVAAEKIYLKDCLFRHNKAKISGGAVYMQHVGTANLRDNVFDGGNQAGAGSAVFYTTTWLADPNYRNVHQDPFYVVPDSNLVHAGGNLRMTGNTVSNNSAIFSGAVHIEGGTVAHVEWTNFSMNSGGAVHATERSCIFISNSWMSFNTNVGSGGAFQLSGMSKGVLNSVTVADNMAFHGGGGFVCDHAIVEITNSTFSRNVAKVCGGGFALNGSKASVWNGISTVCHNSALNGGGICLMLPSTRNCFDFPHVVHGNGTVMLHNNLAELGGGNMFVDCSPRHSEAGSSIRQLAETGSAVLTRVLPLYTEMMHGHTSEPFEMVHGHTSGHASDEAHGGSHQSQQDEHGLEIADAGGSKSGYGTWLATPPLHLGIEDFVSAYAPGESVKSSIRMVDGLRQKMLRKSGQPLDIQVLVEIFFIWGEPSEFHHQDRKSVVLERIREQTARIWSNSRLYSYTFSADGTCQVSNLNLEWPVWNGVPANGLFIMHTPTPAIETARQHSITYFARRNPCPPSTYVSSVRTELSDGAISLSLCQPCQVGSYSVVDDAEACNSCPLGGICTEGHFVGRQDQGSEWEEQDGLMRLVACEAGFVLVRDEGSPRFDQCVMCPVGTFLSEAPVLASGFLVASEAVVATTQCRRCPDGMQCDGGSHIVPADIQVFPVASPNASVVEEVGTCRRRMAECANSSQGTDAWFLVQDRKKRPDLNITWVLHLPLEVVYGSVELVAPLASRRQGGVTGEYLAKISTKEVGSWVLEFIVDGVQLRNSPFVLRVTPAVCDSEQRRTPDKNGTCVCDNDHFELFGLCIGNTPFILGVVLSSVGVICLVAYLVDRRRRQNAENWWRIDAREIAFSVPPKVLGQGTYGWVVMAYYRGTTVAVKRVFPYPFESKVDKASAGTSQAATDGHVEGPYSDDEPTERASATRPRADSHGWGERSVTSGGKNHGADSTSDGSFNSLQGSQSFLPQFFGSGLGSLTGSRRKRRSEKEVASELKNSLSQPKLRDAVIVPAGATSCESLRVVARGNGEESEINGVAAPTVAVSSGVLNSAAGTSTASNVGGCLGFVSSFQRSLKREWKRRQGIKSFLEEIRCIASLRHPNICLVLGAVMSNEEPMLVMEHMQNGSLSDVLANETVVLEGDTLVAVVTDVIQGMVFLESFNPPIVHGDLKARNILIGANLRAKVSDFGLTKGRRVGAGTPLWMAPELLMGGEATVKSDVYAFGITLYEIITRRDPFDGQDLIEVLQRVVDPDETEERNRPEIPQSCPAAIATEMRKCWSFEPADRPTFHDLHKWVHALDSSTILPQSMSHADTDRRFDRSLIADMHESALAKFPKHVAEALAEGKLPPPDTTECATIFCSNVVGFDSLSQKLSSPELVDLLDRLYGAFDDIAAAYDVFKVDTVGDTYVAVTNLATSQEDHAERLTRFAMHVLRKASTILVHPEKLQLGFVDIRIGMHSGPLAASVVGTRAKKYCLFGDSLNTACRMEETGVPGKVHMSKQCARLVNAQAPDIGLVERGVIRIKGKGNMRTYFLIRDDELGEDQIYLPPQSLAYEPGDFDAAWDAQASQGMDTLSYDLDSQSRVSYAHGSATGSHSLVKRKMRGSMTSWFQGLVGARPGPLETHGHGDIRSAEPPSPVSGVRWGTERAMARGGSGMVV